MEKYNGSVTANSAAIQLEKGLFRQHPEFSREAKVSASVVAPGKILISLEEETSADEQEDDPILSAFLSFVENDMSTHPEHIAPFTESNYRKSMELTSGVEVTDSDTIPNDITQRQNF